MNLPVFHIRPLERPDVEDAGSWSGRSRRSDQEPANVKEMFLYTTDRLIA